MVRAEPRSIVAYWIVGMATVGMLLIMVVTAAQKVGDTIRQIGQGNSITQPSEDARRFPFQPPTRPGNVRLTAVVRS